MPQSIYQGSRYMGEEILTVPPPEWRKCPVWNWVENAWIQLNADIGPVDFAVRNVAYDRAMIEIHDSQGYDHVGTYRVWLKTGAGAFVRRTDLDIPEPDPTKFTTQQLPSRWITGLAANTDYTVRINVDLLSGGVSPDSDRSFKTATNPAPLAVTTLRATAATNTYIDLAWTKPPGSTATSYRVFYGRAGQGGAGVIQVPTASTLRVTGLQENTKYWYYVKGVNAGVEGPKSNQIQWATGWGEIRRQGSDDNIIWKPREWGSYRQDIQWRWARESGVLPKNPHLYQGYWPGDNWHGASNPSSNPAAGRTRRYWGTVVYTDDTIRSQLNAKHGAGVGDAIVISKLAFRRMYRHVAPGNIADQNMMWHLTNANPFNSGQPPTYDEHNGRNMKAGEKIDYYPLKTSWGTKLVRGKDGGTAVNGLVMHRSDNVTNGYGAAGYGRWSGHMLDDPDASGSWRHSDLSLMMEGSWTVLVRAYKGPYQW